MPTQAGAVFLTRILAGLHAGGVKYLGQKGHAQKVLSYIHKARNLDFPEAQLEESCQNLLDLEAYPKRGASPIWESCGILKIHSSPICTLWAGCWPKGVASGRIR